MPEQPAASSKESPGPWEFFFDDTGRLFIVGAERPNLEGAVVLVGKASYSDADLICRAVNAYREQA